MYSALLAETDGPEFSRRMLGNNDFDKPYGSAPTTIGGRDGYGWVGLFDGHEHGVLLIPSDCLVVIHLANSEVAPGSQIAEAVAQMAYELPVPVRDEARPIPLEPEPFTSLAGRWVMTPTDLEQEDRPQSTAYITTTAASTMLVLERGGESLHYRRVVAEG